MSLLRTVAIVGAALLLTAGCATAPSPRVLAGAPDCPADAGFDGVWTLPDAQLCGLADAELALGIGTTYEASGDGWELLAVQWDREVDTARATAETINILTQERGWFAVAGRAEPPPAPAGEADVELDGVDAAVLFTDLEQVVDGETWYGRAMSLVAGSVQVAAVVHHRDDGAGRDDALLDVVTTLRPTDGDR